MSRDFMAKQSISQSIIIIFFMEITEGNWK